MLDVLETRKAEVAAICRRFGVRRLDLFGSAATSEFRSDRSDLDFLVEFEPPTSSGLADRYFGLIEQLTRLFDRPVDLVITSAIRNPYFRESVERTRVPLYAG